MMKLHRQKGVAAVELALILVLMLGLCFGIVEVGRSLYYYNSLVKATRGAARYLTTKDLNDSSSTKAAAIVAAKNLAVCGTIATCTSTTSLVPGLTVSKVTVTTNNNVHAIDDLNQSVGTVSLVTVRIGPDEPVNQNDPKAVRFNTFLPFTITSFNFSPVKITMAWSTT